MRVAIVHDFLNQMGGAERVVKTFMEIFPDAPIYTSVYNPSAVCQSFASAEIHTSFMQRLPFVGRNARMYLPLYPHAFESFDLSEYDVVLSSSSSFAKGAVTGRQTCHICYCHNPMRFAWNYASYIEQEAIPSAIKRVLPFFIRRLREWDRRTANRVDCYVANSMTVRSRIREYYGRDSAVIHPPVSTSRFPVSEHDDGYYVVLSRLLPYKRIDIVIDAFNRMRLPLKIIGSGRDSERLKSLSGATIELLGRLTDAEMQDCLCRCRALIFPGLEDFGIAPVEAMSCGKPVIAYGAGGALDTVVEGITGVFFDQQTPDAVVDAVSQFRPEAFDPWQIRKHAERFDESVFKRAIARFVADSYEAYSSSDMFGRSTDIGILPRVEERTGCHDDLSLH